MTPTREAFTRDFPKCPRCGAHKGRPCRTSNGDSARAHLARLELMIPVDRIKELQNEKELIEREIEGCRQLGYQAPQHLVDELWTVNEALRFAAKGGKV